MRRKVWLENEKGSVMALIPCHECKNEVSTSAKSCPKCGAKVKVPRTQSSPGFQKFVIGFVVVIGAIVLIPSLMPYQKPQSPEERAAEAEKIEQQRLASLTPEQRAVEQQQAKAALEARLAARKAVAAASQEKARQEADAEKKRVAALTPAQRSAEYKKKIDDTAAAAATDAIAKAGPRPEAGEHGVYIVQVYLKRTLTDPEGFRMDGCTSPELKAGSWVVDCKYIARNGFGGLVRSGATFYIRNNAVVATN